MNRSLAVRRPARIPRVEVLEDRVTPAGDFLLTLAHPGPALADQAGTSVAIDDRYVVVGAPFDDPGGVTDAGAAYVFNRATGDLVMTIPNPEPAAGDRFGTSVVLFGGAGWISAPFDDPGGLIDAGSVYSFGVPGSGMIPNIPLDRPSPAAGDQFGYSLASDGRGQMMAIGVPGANSGAGRAHLATFTGASVFGFPANNPSPAPGDRFGESVAVTVLGGLLIGAPGDDPGGLTDAGSLFYFDESSRVTFDIANPDPDAGDRYGAAVAVGEPSFLAVVGAPGDDPDGVSDAGSVYAIDANLSAGSFGQIVATLDNPSPQAGDQFGAAIAIDHLVALVGAPGDDPSAVTDAGSAYEFRASSGELLATLNNPEPTAGDQFGRAVALYRDRGVVAAPFDDPGGVTDTGSALVFDTNNPPTVLDDAVIVSKNAGPTPVVALGTDSALPDRGEFLTVSQVTQGVNGGVVAVAPGGTVVTYTPAAGFVGTDSFTYTVSDGRGGLTTGTVTVTIINPPNPGLVATLGPPPEPSDVEAFGPAVAASEDWVLVRSGRFGPIGVYDADTGVLVSTLPNPPVSGLFAPTSVAVWGNRAVVGHEGTAAYLYDLSSGTLLRTFTPPSSIPFYGISVAISGDTVVVGSYQDNEGFTNPHPDRSGRVFVYNANTGALIRTIVNPTFDFLEEGFGTAVAVSGNTLVVGAYHGLVAPNVVVGQAYVYDLTTGQLLHTLNSPARHFHQLFGISVAVSGDRVAVGSREKVYLFDATTGELTATLGDPTPTFSDNFGTTVALSGDRVLAGALGDDPGGLTDAGAAYLFDAMTGTFLRSFDNPVPAAGDRFGIAVALAGSRAVVGAWQADAAPGAGAAYLFDLAFPVTLQDDAFTLAEDSPATVLDVLANDIAVPGESGLSVTAVTQPEHGTVTLTGGVVRYTPDADYHGPDTFTYEVSDGRGGIATADVNLTVSPTNDAPTLPGATFVLAENSPIGTTVGTVTGTDVDGDTLTYQIIGGNTGGAFAIHPLTGRLFVANPAALDFEQTPTFTLTVGVRDPGDLAATGTVTVNLTDVPEVRPVAIDIKPGDPSNVIRLRRHPLVRVAILSAADFNALSVNPLSLRFGRTGQEDSLKRLKNGFPEVSIKDVNGDGRRDLVVTFVTQKTGFRLGDTRGFLTGELSDESLFSGEDLVRIR